jgi:hypothetical protein
VRVLIYPVHLKKHRESFSLYLAGDLHYGDPNCDTDAFYPRFIDAVQEDASRVKLVGLMGDYIYEFPKQDKRNYGNTRPNRSGVLGLYSEVRDMLKPISNRVIACLAGNHDEDWYKAENIDFVNWMCAENSIPYCGYECYIRLKIFRDDDNSDRPMKNIDILLWHGAGGGRTAGSAFNKLHNPIDSFRLANIIGMGHVHRLGCLHEEWQDIDEEHLRPKAVDQYFVLTGGYQRGYAPDSTYISRKMLPPVAIGGVKLTITPFRHVSDDKDGLDVEFKEVR